MKRKLATIAAVAALAAPAAAQAAHAYAGPLSTVMFGQEYTKHTGACSLTRAVHYRLVITCAAGQTETVHYRLAKVKGAATRLYFADASGLVSVSERNWRHSRTITVTAGEGTTVIGKATAYSVQP